MNSNLSMESSESVLKILVEGVFNSGKTSLVTRYINNTFSDNSYMIGLDFKFKQLMFNNVAFKLQIWEKPGISIRIPNYDKRYYRNTSGVVYTFDCINQPFEDLEKTIPEIRKNITYLSDEGVGIPIIIAYTKIDLVPKNANNPPDRLVEFAKENSLKIVCCSSKTGTGVEDIFLNILSEMYSSDDYWKTKKESEIIQNFQLVRNGKKNSFCL